ncbi:hypothetical protein [Streptomyces sp. bgisy126]|uniref:hypothetical protein n=1 Tax=unclassified Streptomyces TaxID=2593676 RepID=UPI003EBC2E3A
MRSAPAPRPRRPRAPATTRPARRRSPGPRTGTASARPGSVPCPPGGRGECGSCPASYEHREDRERVEPLTRRRAPRVPPRSADPEATEDSYPHRAHRTWPGGGRGPRGAANTRGHTLRREGNDLTSRHSVVEVATDDMPFLVDSSATNCTPSMAGCAATATFFFHRTSETPYRTKSKPARVHSVVALSITSNFHPPFCTHTARDGSGAGRDSLDPRRARYPVGAAKPLACTRSTSGPASSLIRTSNSPTGKAKRPIAAGTSPFRA